MMGNYKEQSQQMSNSESQPASLEWVLSKHVDWAWRSKQYFQSLAFKDGDVKLS